MSYTEYEESGYESRPARLFLFRVGLTNYAYTSTAVEQSYEALPYVPEAIDMDEIAIDLTEPTRVNTIRMPLSNPFASLYRAYQPIFPPKVIVRRRELDDPSGEFQTEYIGEVTSANMDTGTGECALAVRLSSAKLLRPVPFLKYQRQCNWALYGPGCGVNAEDWKTEGLAVSVEGDVVDAQAFGELPEDWFRAGFVRRVSDGDVRFIIAHSGTSLVLQTPFVDLRPGEPLEAYAGCDRSLGANGCAKFNNIRRSSGFYWPPQGRNPFSNNVFGNSPKGTTTETRVS